MKWADDATKGRLGKYGGKKLTDPGLVHDIVKCHASNGIVARLVEGEWERVRPSKEWFDRERSKLPFYYCSFGMEVCSDADLRCKTERLEEDDKRFDKQEALMNNKLGGRCGTGHLHALQAKRKMRQEDRKGS